MRLLFGKGSKYVPVCNCALYSEQQNDTLQKHSRAYNQDRAVGIWVFFDVFLILPLHYYGK